MTNELGVFLHEILDVCDFTDGHLPINDTEAIRSTTRFKYLRSLEALFESTPQAVIQLVYVMRKGSPEIVFVVSVFQSILSMTNSMINADNIYMAGIEWTKHKQRLPPTKSFLKHGLIRCAEITSRIGLLALFWAVCNGVSFAILLSLELIFPAFFIWYQLRFLKDNLDRHSLFLALNIIIVLPPEWIFETGYYDISDDFESNIALFLFCGIFGHCLLCFNHFIDTPQIESAGSNINKDNGKKKPCNCLGYGFLYANIRIGMSVVEWIFILIAHFTYRDDYNYLFSSDHCLDVFGVSIVCFIIYTQFPYLMPDIRLPHSISIRSKLGYAFLGDVNELRRIKLPPISDSNRNADTEMSDEELRIYMLRAFWDSSQSYEYTLRTPVLYALANSQLETVDWLELQGVMSHQRTFHHELRNYGSRRIRYVNFVNWARKKLDILTDKIVTNHDTDGVFVSISRTSRLSAVNIVDEDELQSAGDKALKDQIARYHNIVQGDAVMNQANDANKDDNDDDDNGNNVTFNNVTFKLILPGADRIKSITMNKSDTIRMLFSNIAQMTGRSIKQIKLKVYETQERIQHVQANGTIKSLKIQSGHGIEVTFTNLLLNVEMSRNSRSLRLDLDPSTHCIFDIFEKIYDKWIVGLDYNSFEWFEIRNKQTGKKIDVKPYSLMFTPLRSRIKMTQEFQDGDTLLVTLKSSDDQLSRDSIKVTLEMPDESKQRLVLCLQQTIFDIKIQIWLLYQIPIPLQRLECNETVLDNDDTKVIYLVKKTQSDKKNDKPLQLNLRYIMTTQTVMTQRINVKQH